MRALWLAAAMISAASTVHAGGYDDLNVGIQRYNLEQWSEVVPSMDKALEDPALSPGQRYAALFDRGSAYYHLHQYDRASADFSAALALRPQNPEALFARQFAYSRAGKFDAAEADLDLVAAAWPDAIFIRVNRAFVNAQMGKTEKAGDEFKAVISMYSQRGVRSSSPEVLGEIYWLAGNIEEADSNFRAGTEHSRGEPVYSWIWYALTQARLGKDIPRRFLPDTDRKSWPGPIVDFILGASDQDAVFAEASKGEKSAVEQQVCEANFFLGEWKLRHQDSAGGAPLLRKAAADCPVEDFQWVVSQMEARNLP